MDFYRLRLNHSKYVVAGSHYDSYNDGNYAVVWESTDLTSWIQRNVVTGVRNQSINSIIYDSTHSKYVAAGGDYSNAIVWESTGITEIYPSNEYYILSTTDSNQIDTSSWVNIISGAITEVLNSQTIYYALSSDDRTIWKVFGLGQSQWRSIAKNDSGTWKYNSNTTYSQETWTVASVNSQERALDQAFGVSANQMSGANFNNISDVNWEATGGWSILVDTLDFTAGLKTTSTSSSPSLSQITINYDSSGGDALTISTSASGTGEIRPIQFQIGSNNKVLVLDTSGNVFIGGNINTVTSSVLVNFYYHC